MTTPTNNPIVAHEAGQPKLPNYRIYDQTGGGVREDIYVEVRVTMEEGDRVEAGEGKDHDTGIIDTIDGDVAVVGWDSGVKTRHPLADLRRLDGRVVGNIDEEATLDEAIKQGREWIEDGDWGKEADEYLFVVPRPELSGDEDSRVFDLLRLDCTPESIRNVSYDDMDRAQLNALADYLCAGDDSVSEEDQEFDISIGQKILSALDGKDVESDKENTEYRLLKLDCCVREIVYVPDLRSITSLPAVIDAHVMPGDGPLRIMVECGPETKLALIPGDLVDGSTLDADGYYDAVFTGINLPMMIDGKATDHGQEWDCSGEFRQAIIDPND